MTQLADFLLRLQAMGLADVIDVALVAGLIFLLLYYVRGTRAVQLLRGILLMVLLMTVFSRIVPLPTFSTIVRTLLPALMVAVPVVFQPELRRLMERLGRAGQLRAPGSGGRTDPAMTAIAAAARRLSALKHGALIVIEGGSPLADLAERGVRLDAVVSVDLLMQIFYPHSPLHDGAVVVRQDRILAARVVLPLRDAPLTNRHGLGTRHLAAVAVSEGGDAVAVVVSEETGIISLARAGHLLRSLDEAELLRLLLLTRTARPPTPAERLLAPWLRFVSGAEPAAGESTATDSVATAATSRSEGGRA